MDSYATFLCNLTVFILGGRLLLRRMTDHFYTFLYILVLAGSIERAGVADLTQLNWHLAVRTLWLSCSLVYGSLVLELSTSLNWFWWFMGECEVCKVN